MTTCPRSEKTWERFKRSMRVGAALAVLIGSAPMALGRGDDGITALAEWSRELWENAKSGQGRQAIGLLERLPDIQEGIEDGQPAGALATAVERYKVNHGKREELRAKRIEELEKEVTDFAAQANLIKGLNSAIELLQISPDKAQRLETPDIKALVDKAKADAARAEAEGKWLDAQGLFYRLHLLYEESRVYEADLKRLSQRLMMLRLYTPERLHQMRDAQRIAEGEDPLPPFNKIGEDWHEKLKSIEESLVIKAIGNAGSSHVDRVSMARMLIGGYQSVRTMATTTDLSDAFPRLKDEKAVESFVRMLDARIDNLTRNPEGVDYRNVIVSVRSLLASNRDTVAIDPEALLHEYGNGAMAELDEFSSIIWPYELPQFQRTTDGTFKGVGVQITMNDAFELKVVTPLDGTPAARAGIRAGDLIRKVDGESTLGMSLLQAVDRITGEEGTNVRLTIERSGSEEPLEFDLTRAVIPIHSVKGWRRSGAKETDWDWLIDPVNRIGYVRVTQFNNQTTQELRAAVREMKEVQAKGLILDLRGNPGGLLSEAVTVASLFIDEGVVVTQEDGEGRERDRQNAVPGLRLGHLPVVVLINGGSASASEIVAGALQDYHAAVIVGERSFGKGSVQNIYQLGPSAVFKLTTQYYRLPGRDGQAGRLIHRRPGHAAWGVEPDIEVEMLPGQLSEAFELRQQSDILDFDAEGRLAQREDAPDLTRLVTEGLDSQLETAVLLVQTQVIPNEIGARAEAVQQPVNSN